ncbi:hypothetical protein KI387_005132, partial [Taxus chinensis]
GLNLPFEQARLTLGDASHRRGQAIERAHKQGKYKSPVYLPAYGPSSVLLVRSCRKGKLWWS